MPLDFFMDIPPVYKRQIYGKSDKKNRRPNPQTCCSAAGSPRHQGEKNTLQQGVTALRTWLEANGWEVSIECPLGEAYAKIERVSKRGIGFVTCIKMTPQSYREAVEDIDPNKAVMEMWQSNENYRAVMGNLATA